MYSNVSGDDDDDDYIYIHVYIIMMKRIMLVPIIRDINIKCIVGLCYY